MNKDECFDWTCPKCGEPVQCSVYNWGIPCPWEEEKNKQYIQYENSKRA